MAWFVSDDGGKALPHSGFSLCSAGISGDNVDTLWQGCGLGGLVSEGGGRVLPHSGSSSLLGSGLVFGVVRIRIGGWTYTERFFPCITCFSLIFSSLDILAQSWVLFFIHFSICFLFLPLVTVFINIFGDPFHHFPSSSKHILLYLSVFPFLVFA